MKTILLAGVSSKIGQALANQLLMQGHKLILVNRKSPAFDRAVQRLSMEHGEKIAGRIYCDFSDLYNIDRLVETLAADYPVIKAVYYNVGTIKQEKVIQPQGFEEQFMVNAVAPWYLLKKLREIRNEPLQVVCSGSAASQMVKRLDVEELVNQNHYHGFKTAYAPSKAALKVFMHHFQAINPTWNLSVVDLWPTKTDMVTNEALPWLMRKLSFAFRKPEQSALRLGSASKEINIPKNLISQETELIDLITKTMESSE